MKREWKNPKLNNLNIVNTYGCQYFQAIGSEIKESLGEIKTGTTGDWCCSCARGLSNECNGLEEYKKNGGTCAIS